mmetsp:Transcript_6754/g.11876  ORF Transcript_6754/g.11876 Transcript_6754/m.11876 type:complete len:262 (-) Transcript_6754:118-903(-)
MGLQACKPEATCHCLGKNGPCGHVRNDFWDVDIDFDRAARLLSRCSDSASLDMLFEHPATHGRLFVGSQRAASSHQDLSQHSIKHVVNCLDPTRPNFFEAEDGFEYLRFPIAHWRGFQLSTAKQVARYFAPLLGFVRLRLQAGHSILLHCLAGAHRAGTAGIACLMFLEALNSEDAVLLAKKRRPIINPIAGFPELLLMLERTMETQPNQLELAIEEASQMGFSEAAKRWSIPSSFQQRAERHEHDEHLGSAKILVAHGDV